MPDSSYGASQIRVLKGLEAVQKRPAMYIGDTSHRGLHHIVFEVIDNSVDETLAGFCDAIEIVIHTDGSVSVIDNGRGIPVDMHAQEKRPALEVVHTVLHAGGKFGEGAYKVSGGLHGVGVSCTNALSEWLEVEVRRDGHRYTQRYERGKPVTKVTKGEKVKGTGTATRFKPDPLIFETVEFEFEYLARRCRELAYLTGGARFTVRDERTGKEEVYQYKGGIVDYIKALNSAKSPLHRPIHLVSSRDDVDVEVVIQYHDSYQETTLSFANLINTMEGGTHVTGFRTALTRVINQYGRNQGLLKEKDANLSGEDVRDGLTAIISVKLGAPQFEGQTKTKLGNREVDGLVNSLVGEGLATWFEEHPTEARCIVRQSQVAQQAREAARKQAELVRRKSALSGGMGLPGKLFDCRAKDPSVSELFIVEGDSAAGPAKGGRNSEFQAILPLRGKILNVEKHRLDKILGNQEIQHIIAALGTGIISGGNGNGDGRANPDEDESTGEETGLFDLSKLRYSRVIIMTDADVDGSHIRTLLLTFFFRYMQPLIEQGHVYIAQPPLYSIKQGGKTYYALTDEERDKLLAELPQRGRAMYRFKGLGEMNAEDLATTTMEPETRIIRKVTLDDAAEADQIFSTLMGSLVEPRKEFIADHAREVENIDF
ncbi:MAG: type IIA DNA topoisomerase subunit B [Armatimonadetes bacterium]|nr:type IIA DNA topoisomerase subunit B [Armatimonadota bacterium]